MMPQDLPNWITAGATAATAIASAMAGVVAYLTWRRDRPFPVIEATSQWRSRPELPSFLEVNILARNVLWETISIDSVQIKQPRSMTLAHDELKSPNSMKLEDTGNRELALNWKIGPSGEWHETFHGRFPARRADVRYDSIYLVPSPRWGGGEVKLVFRVSSRARTIRDKRIVVTQHVTAAPQTKTDAMASSQT